MTESRADSKSVKKLTKRKKETGELYTRRADAELQIAAVLIPCPWNFPPTVKMFRHSEQSAKCRKVVKGSLILSLLQPPLKIE